MQFMFTSPWHIKAQQVHKKMLWSHKASIFQLFCFFVFLKQLHISPSQEKRGRLMWRWWGFFVFVLFFSVPFSQPLWHNPRKNSRHFRHDSRTISETLWHEAEQPSKRLVQSKERLQPLGGRLSNERSTGNRHVLHPNPSQIGKSEEERLQMPAFNYLFNGCKHKLKVHIKEKRIHSTIRNLWGDPKCSKLQKYV